MQNFSTGLGLALKVNSVVTEKQIFFQICRIVHRKHYGDVGILVKYKYNNNNSLYFTDMKCNIWA